MWNSKTVSVIFPAFNEAENILPAISDFLKQPWVDELVVVDNNSTDGTGNQVLQTGATLIRETKQGYGFALQRGLRDAKGDLLILAEPDGTFEGRDIIKLLGYADDFDLVLGTRTDKRLIQPGANMPWYLRLVNIGMAKFLQYLFRSPSLTDCGCTLRLLHRSLYKEIEPSLSVGQSHFLPELVILSLLRKASLIEVPVHYRKRIGASKITGRFYGMALTGMHVFGLIIKYRMKSLFTNKTANRGGG